MYTPLPKGSSPSHALPLASVSSPPRPDPLELASQIRERARALGFDAVAIARADVPLDEEMVRYEAFLAAGMHASMGYLAENREVRRRLDSEKMLLGARSVVCLARRYAGPASGDVAAPDQGEVVPRVARYARGRDYHGFLRKKLRSLAAFVRRLPGEPRARPLCDDAPILERAWAARAGLGFIGKHGLLIVPGQGSFVLLGEVLTTLELPPDAPLEGRCGACTLCLDACPTRAFPRPFVLDARRCIAYWTIEHRGGIPEPVRGELGDHLFGCDDCQSVCPFNASSQHPVRRGTPFEPSDALRRTTLGSLLSPSDPDHPSPPIGVREGSPFKRAGEEGIARNAAIVLGNQGDREALAPLLRARDEHPSLVVRDAASWAVARVQSRYR
jgi:epoxyqueuosine reductase